MFKGMLALVFLQALSAQVNATDAWIYGDPEARWTLIEYADLECPYCKAYSPKLMDFVEAKRTINLQWWHLPLPAHGEMALHNARLAECAGQLAGTRAAFWIAVKQIFSRTRSNGLGFSGELEVPGITPEALGTCASTNEAIARRVLEQQQAAFAHGIEATPTVEVKDNATGKSLKLEGEVSPETLLSAIDWLAAQSQ